MAQSTIVSTGSNVVKTGKGKFYGFIAASSSSGTLKAWDSLTAAGRVLMDTTGSITAPFNGQLANGIEFQTGLTVTCGGTVSAAILWE